MHQDLENTITINPRGDDALYFFKPGRIWTFMRTQHFGFWMICLYLFFEYSRPQAIFPVIDFLPWTQILIIVSFIGALADPSVGWVKSKANTLLLMFSLALYLSSLFAVFPEVSKASYDAYFLWVPIYFLIINIVNTRERFYVFLLVFLLSAGKIAIGTARQWAGRGFSFTGWGLQGPMGFFCNSGELSILMCTLFPVAVLLLIHKKNKITVIEKILLIAITFSPVLTILGASSRGSQIAFAAQLIVMFWKKIFNFKWLIIIAVLVFAGYKLLPQEQKDRFSNMGEDGTSIQRKLYWKHGREIIKKYPVLGIGFYNFPKYYQTYFSYDLFFRHAELPHNIFIQVGTDAGFSGLVPFSLILLYTFITPFSYAKKRKADDSIVLTLLGTGYGIFGFVIAGQFVTVTYYPFLWVGLAFIVAGKNILQKEDRALYYSLVTQEGNGR